MDKIYQKPIKRIKSIKRKKLEDKIDLDRYLKYLDMSQCHHKNKFILVNIKGALMQI